MHELTATSTPGCILHYCYEGRSCFCDPQRTEACFQKAGSAWTGSRHFLAAVPLFLTHSASHHNCSQQLQFFSASQIPRVSIQGLFLRVLMAIAEPGKKKGAELQNTTACILSGVGALILQPAVEFCASTASRNSARNDRRKMQPKIPAKRNIIITTKKRHFFYSMPEEKGKAF